MRIGTNPAKLDNQLTRRYYHRVIIPVYIPELSGYFADGLKILQLCLESLFLTINDKTAVTIINNACCREVTEYLAQLFNEGKIDTLIHNRENKGKIDPLMSAVRGSYEPLITLSDADVLFLNGWQEAVEEVFHYFPRAGMVSPVPGAKAYNSFTSYTLLCGLLHNNMRFEKSCDPQALMMFAKSIGREDDFYKPIHLEKQLVMKKGNFRAVVGCGHFVATLRKEVFKFAPEEPSMKKILGNSENDYIDIPNDKAGFLRLATVNNHAFHLGNKLEDWMIHEFNKVRENFNPVNKGSDLSIKLAVNPTPFLYKLRNKIIGRIMKTSTIKKMLFHIWGIPKELTDAY